jgi:hypothetical protein
MVGEATRGEWGGKNWGEWGGVWKSASCSAMYSSLSVGEDEGEGGEGGG